MFIDIVPIVMAGIIGIYGLVVSVLIANDLAQQLSLYTGFIQLGAGLAVGLAGMAAGYVFQPILYAALIEANLVVLLLVLSVMPVSAEQLSNPDSTSE